VGDVGADLTFGLVHPLLDLGVVRLDDERPLGPRRPVPGRIAFGDQPGHRVMGTAGQLGGGTRRTGQIKRF
jgi:hypothetical protein